MTAQEYTKKWKNLRDTFVRELKKTKAQKSGDKGPNYTSQWPYFEQLLFLTDTVRHKPLVNYTVITGQCGRLLYWLFIS